MRVGLHLRGRGIHSVGGFLAGWVIILDYVLVPGLPT